MQLIHQKKVHCKSIFDRCCYYKMFKPDNLSKTTYLCYKKLAIFRPCFEWDPYALLRLDLTYLEILVRWSSAGQVGPWWGCRCSLRCFSSSLGPVYRVSPRLSWEHTCCQYWFLKPAAVLAALTASGRRFHASITLRLKKFLLYSCWARRGTRLSRPAAILVGRLAAARSNHCSQNCWSLSTDLPCGRKL
jgi:hypothetical protein